MCPRTDTQLAYMIDIALTTEFAIGAGPTGCLSTRRRLFLLRSSRLTGVADEGGLRGDIARRAWMTYDGAPSMSGHGEP